MPDRLLGVFGHQAFELRLCLLVFEVSLSGLTKDVGEFGPGIGRAHVYDPHGLNAGAWWLNAEEARGLSAPHAPPEFLFRRQQEVLIERIGRHLDLEPLSAAGD